ncbi:transposase [Streptomyces sp. UNOB3_S3]|uniref:IS701 family transposase n=1 Tax=Streptomyces sp. UNOB3_S3 TaxID=2871682 RepID=UPI001E389B16|nr:transposase [Streptomyces sp. UNOB3_S3]MCC3774819.1 transposase [Streptomyces sp. UNOB3_S3]
MAVHHSTRPFTPGTAPLVSFAEEVFGYLPRADQRRWAHAYLEGLLSTPGKKTVRRLAAAVSASPTASQSLHQFVNASPWDWGPAMRSLAHWTLPRAAPRAWTIGTVVVPKRGESSVGVHRRFDPASGRTVNCQVGVGIFLSTEDGPVPLGWRILLPSRWTDDDALRERARIPESSVGDRPASAQVLDLVHTLHSRTTAMPLPVVADMSSCAEAASLIRGLDRAGCDFVVAVPSALAVLPGGRSRGEGQGGPVPVRRLVHQGDGLGEFPALLGAPGTVPAGQPRRLLNTLVRLPERPGDRTGTTPPVHRAFARRVPGRQADEPVWITNLTRHSAEELIALTGHHTRTAGALRTLEDDFGLRDFEGRSFPGWHHHMTLVSAAFAYSRLAGSAAERADRPLAVARSA